jgi:hypothetical protein
MADLEALLLAFREAASTQKTTGRGPARSALCSVQRELLEEACGALGRTGRRLDAVRDELDALRASYQSEPLPATRAAYAEARARFLQLITELEIQREAIGMRRHDQVRAHYPLPPISPE